MSIENLIENAVDSVANLMRKGHVIVNACSFGKDSVCCVLMTIAAAKKVMSEGFNPKILLCFSDTGVENPENLNYAMNEMGKLKDWARANKVDLTCFVSQPSLSASFPVRILGGRALPSFPGTNHDCSSDWKVIPAQRMRKRILSQFKKSEIKPITIVGTRYDESEARARRMKERGDSAIHPIENKDGDLVLSLIAEWLTDEVWEVIAMAGSKAIESYSDFEDTFRLYADAGGTSCAVVSDVIMSAKPKQGCGARQGCHTCTAVGSDSSMENFIAGDARYAYLKSLNNIRNFIAATRWDMSRRTWIGRSIIDGYIAIGPDAYSPAMMRELFRYYVTADRDERRRSRSAGEAPKFNVVPLAAVVAIDAQWSLQGYHPAHTAVRDYITITEGKESYYPPSDTPTYIRPLKLPKAKYLYVGDEWDSELSQTKDGGMFDGLRDPLMEMVSEGGCMGLKTLSNGNVVMDVETSDSFEVDEEGAYLAMSLLGHELVEKHNSISNAIGFTSGYLYWAGLGTISLSPQQVSMHDAILKRTNFKERLGLLGDNLDIEAVLSRSVDAKSIAEEIVILLEESKAPDIKLYHQADLFLV